MSINPGDWTRIEPLLDAALDLPAAKRSAFLAHACGDDEALRRTIERMLRDGEDPNGPLEHSFALVAGPLMLDDEETVDANAPVGAIIGSTVGAWRIVRALGHGGMGEVFLAERTDEQFAQRAALKVVRRGREHDPLLIRRFLEERRILAALAHPNVALLLDGGVTSTGMPWFAMEFVDGQPLDAYCDERRLDVTARLLLMEQVLGAVAYAHRNLLVHRDLKPGNIFVTTDGQVKLLDFGIAKLLGAEHVSDETLTLLEARVMTPEYAAPEQVRGDAVTTATDVYALGAVMYQLLTGQRAHQFVKRTAAEIERVVCETDPAPPSAVARAAHTDRTAPLREGISSEIDTIVLKALQKDPARRYASVDAMLDDLRRLRTGRPLNARPDSLGYRWSKFVSRNRVGVAAAALVVVATVSGVVATASQARAARIEAARADRVKDFLIDLLREADPNITQGKEFSVRQLLDRGTQLADSSLGAEPTVQADMYEVLGNTYAHLGLSAQADTLHRKGLAVTRRLYGPGNENVLNQEMSVGWGLNDRGKYADADTLLTRAISAYRAAGGKDSQALCDAIGILATAKKRLDKPAVAESLYRDALARQIRLTGPSDTITAGRLSDLASLLAAQNRLAPAESALVAAQSHRVGVLSPLDVRYLVGESSLATILVKRGKIADAEPRAQRAVAGLEKVESAGGLNLARTIDKLAMLQWLAGHTAIALVTSERALTMFRTTIGEDHPETFNSQSARAMFEASAGMLAPAESDARMAFDALQRKQGPRHEMTLTAGQRLAAIQIARGDARGAAATLARVLPVVREKFGAITPTYASLLASDAAVRLAARDSTAAESGYRDALKALAGGTYVDSAAFPSIAKSYATLLTSRGRATDATPLLQRVQAFQR